MNAINQNCFMCPQIKYKEDKKLEEIHNYKIKYQSNI